MSPLQPLSEAFWDQLATLLILLERPAVQRQILASFCIIVLAWFVPKLISWAFRPVRNHISQHSRSISAYLLLRMLRASAYTFFPLLGILLSRLSMRYFIYRDWRFGLIEALLPLFWLLLGYRVILASLYALFKEKTARMYHQHVVTPLFFIFVALVVAENFAPAISLNDLRVFSFNDVDISFGALFRALVIFGLFLTAGWLSKDILSRVVLPRVTSDAGLSNAVVTTTYYLVLVIGVLTAATILGIDFTTLAIIGGGLTVGIGFGLQDLVNNFVSGILLLFERTLRPGDVVEVSGQRGVVHRLRMRSTILRTVDNIEIIVPNKTFLSSNVATYTQTDRVVRRVVSVGVSYDSNPTEVREILLGVAERHGLVLDKPEPAVFFVDFGESSLLFDLAVFVDDPMFSLKVTSDLRFMIWSEFAKHDIEIPFPQRDLHLRNVPWEPSTQAEATEPALAAESAGAPQNDRGLGPPEELLGDERETRAPDKAQQETTPKLP